MSLADRVAAEVVRLRSDARILTIDIERLPGRARMEHRGLTIEGDFWDLSGWKYIIGRRIHPDDVIEWPRTICAAWKWHGTPRVHFAAEWLPGDTSWLHAAWDAYDEADIVVGHNLAGFDTKKLRGAWLELGLPEPRPFKTIDTLKVAREFGFESNTLDALCKRLGIPAKTDKYSVEIARRHHRDRGTVRLLPRPHAQPPAHRPGIRRARMQPVRIHRPQAECQAAPCAGTRVPAVPVRGLWRQRGGEPA